MSNGYSRAANRVLLRHYARLRPRRKKAVDVLTARFPEIRPRAGKGVWARDRVLYDGSSAPLLALIAVVVVENWLLKVGET
jgi:hypothetical protein